MSKCVIFWRHFLDIFHEKDVMQGNLQTLKWNELGSLLYTLSQIKLLQSPADWQVITEIFLDRIEKDYDQEKVIKSITSLSLA